MESFLVSTSVVALAEIGDKTQLLSLILAARFRKPCRLSWVSWSPPYSITLWRAHWVRGCRPYLPLKHSIG